jgi:hypothetical protein
MNPNDRLVLIDRLITLALKDEMAPRKREVMVCIQYLACGTYYEAPATVLRFLKAHFASDHLIWTVVSKGP